jgi:hypothetical protein
LWKNDNNFKKIFIYSIVYEEVKKRIEFYCQAVQGYKQSIKNRVSPVLFFLFNRESKSIHPLCACGVWTETVSGGWGMRLFSLKLGQQVPSPGSSNTSSKI